MLTLILSASLALAADTWTNVRTGVDYLHRTTGDPLDIYAVRVDLTVPNVGLHASADASGTERGVTGTTFARNADALVSINADWSDGSTPVGLAISDGSLWHSHIPDNTVGGSWGFFACTATKECTIASELPLDQAWWFGSPTLPPYRYFQATGANGNLLIVDGVPWSGCYDSARNPRSAIGLEADGTHLWLVVVDGRSSRSVGMTCDEARALMQDLGCTNAAMLDGGGSSTLVIEGAVKNTPSDGSQRTVSNHIGILYSDTLDPRCAVSSGRWCDGTVISACQGGRFIGTGDCAFYGASCQEDGDYAFCVDYRCPGGDGNGAECSDATHFAYCADGQYSSGDCGAFGLACGTDDDGATCMDSRCAAGPNASFCSDGLFASCADGVYTESACGGGAHCDADAAGAFCADDRCPAEGGVCQGEVFQSCDRGVYAEVDCAATGTVCDEGGCVGLSDDSDPRPGDDSASEDPGDTRPLSTLGGCGCQSTTDPSSLAALLGVALSLGARRRAGR